MIEVDLEEEKREIIRRYRKLLRHAKPILKSRGCQDHQESLLHVYGGAQGYAP